MSTTFIVVFRGVKSTYKVEAGSTTIIQIDEVKKKLKELSACDKVNLPLSESDDTESWDRFLSSLPQYYRNYINSKGDIPDYMRDHYMESPIPSKSWCLSLDKRSMLDSEIEKFRYGRGELSPRASAN